MKWGLWSTTAASNASAPPDGWPEGQAPSTVNDCAREMMAAIRTGLNDLANGWVDLGFSPTFVSSTKFTVPGDLTPYLPQGARIRVSDASVLYGQVISASFSTNSAFTVTLDSGNLTSSLTSIAVGVIKSGVTGANIPNAFKVEGTISISSNVAGAPLTITNNAAQCDFWMRCSGGAKMIDVTSTSLFRIVNSANNVVLVSLTDAGAMTVVGDITAFSDERTKAEWAPLQPDFVSDLAGIERWGTYVRDGETHVGVGAQSLQKFMPNAVLDNEGGMLSVAYGNAALAACVALAKKVVELEKRLDELT